MPRTVNFMDAARMTAQTSRETALRVSQYFGDAGPFSYGSVKKLTAALLSGTLPYHVIVAGLEKVTFELAEKCNLEVAKILFSCEQFRGSTFYPLKRLTYSIDQDFALGIRPETVAVVNGVPNLLFVQARKHPVPWAFNASFMRRLLQEVYEDYFDAARFWLVDTEADSNGERSLKLVDLQSVAPMSEREFGRRIAALRNAWRLHLTSPRPRKDRRDGPDDRQPGFFDAE